LFGHQARRAGRVVGGQIGPNKKLNQATYLQEDSVLARPLSKLPDTTLEYGKVLRCIGLHWHHHRASSVPLSPSVASSSSRTWLPDLRLPAFAHSLPKAASTQSPPSRRDPPGCLYHGRRLRRPPSHPSSFPADLGGRCLALDLVPGTHWCACASLYTYLSTRLLDRFCRVQQTL